MSTKYTFSISGDTLNGIVNLSGLTSEITSSSITIALDYINTDNDVCDIWFKEDIVAEQQTTLNSIMADHTGESPDYVEPPTMADGRPIVRSDTRPLDTATYFSCVGDTTSGIGDGVDLMWDFSSPDEYTTISGPYTLSCGHEIADGYKAQIIDLSFLDDVYFKDGALYFFDMPWKSSAKMEVLVPAGNYYPNEHGSIPASALGLPGNDMYSYATTDTPYYIYVGKHFMYGDCPMGDELNAEGAMIHALPPNWMVRAVITVPITGSDNAKGFASFEMYRHRTAILPGDTI